MSGTHHDGELPVFDLNFIQDQWGNIADDTYRMVLEIFTPEMDQLCAALHEAAARQDRAALRRCAHTLRGAAQNVGAARLAREADLIERSAEGDLAVRLAGLERARHDTAARLKAGGP